MQPVLQDRIAMARVTTLAAVNVKRDLWSVLNRIAEALEPAERSLFGIRLVNSAVIGSPLVV